ncbi:MAG TPA: hypothetical protein P5186_24170 [Candidatus Paceibacterota bacterium]|nr:hypothetical protein [Verrucomicrobiota bacterium]HRY51158.1 hypothetical protein [Candidatus Paceibacterota bacterium]HSA01592.1 hypothetical protein [Candidatus Paceibacterota bacterium]
MVPTRDKPCVIHAPHEPPGSEGRVTRGPDAEIGGLAALVPPRLMGAMRIDEADRTVILD